MLAYLIYRDQLQGASFLLLPITIGCLIPMLRLFEVTVWPEWQQREARARSGQGQVLDWQDWALLCAAFFRRQPMVYTEDRGNF